MKMTLEQFLGFAGTVIALAALAITVWQGALTRRHNRMSVKPILRIDRNNAEGEPINITLRNTGFGPAIIKSYSVSLDDHIIQLDTIEKGAQALTRLGVDPVRFHVFAFLKGDSFSSGESQSLFATRERNFTDVQTLAIARAMNRLTITIEYESIYQEEFVLHDRGKAGAT